MQRIAIVTSGGDAPGMNAAIRALVRVGIGRGFEMLGVRNGYSGLIAGELVRLNVRDVGGIIHQGGTMLGTSRCEAFKTEAGQLQAVQQLQQQEISTLVVIGGNGSQTGALTLSRRGVHVVGVASTIDNDLYGTDVSIGTTTALDTALDAIDRLRVTAASHHRAFLVEVMGRHSGYLALQAAVAGGAEAVIVPEVEIHPEALAAQLRACHERGKSHGIVVVAEGAKLNATALLRYFTEHRERLGFELRATALGHVQRGGAPGIYDRLLATRFGTAAIEHIEAGQTGILIGLLAGQIAATPLTQVVGKTKAFDERLYQLAEVLAQ